MTLKIRMICLAAVGVLIGGVATTTVFKPVSPECTVHSFSIGLISADALRIRASHSSSKGEGGDEEKHKDKSPEEGAGDRDREEDRDGEGEGSEKGSQPSPPGKPLQRRDAGYWKKDSETGKHHRVKGRKRK
ncbi:putative transmembrane protein [Toxoplasma gondii p89]|uniref:Putative transmembrane protein n=1 Tax=Toxoplasma gondii p89 TaxID=943119 RepID=A0A086K577_TOXGO|nr:putative transmembrane protein [Toxoplasma gondii p89]